MKQENCLWKMQWLQNRQWIFKFEALFNHP